MVDRGRGCLRKDGHHSATPASTSTWTPTSTSILTPPLLYVQNYFIIDLFDEDFFFKAFKTQATKRIRNMYLDIHEGWDPNLWWITEANLKGLAGVMGLRGVQGKVDECQEE